MAIELRYEDLVPGQAAEAKAVDQGIAAPELGFEGFLGRVERILGLINGIVANYQQLKSNFGSGVIPDTSQHQLVAGSFTPDNQPIDNIRQEKQTTMNIETMLKAKLIEYLKGLEAKGFGVITLEQVYEQFKALSISDIIEVLEGKAKDKDATKPNQ